MGWREWEKGKQRERKLDLKMKWVKWTFTRTLLWSLSRKIASLSSLWDRASLMLQEGL